MAASGSRRLVVGAHYGLLDWLLQRITAVVILAYALLVGGLWLAADRGYEGWAGLFVPLPMKVASVLAFAALAFHAWVGVRDIWMDYVKPTGIRLALHLATILMLAACLVWAAQILWKV